MVQAHPRSRGENGSDRRKSVAGSGSSPLTRGKPDRRRVRRCHIRLIPAHAGKTTYQNVNDAATEAHPRSRGENRCAQTAIRRSGGSSPLTRGKPHLGTHLEMGLRLIPAHAGKTRCRHRRGSQILAHPRSRGENLTEPIEAAAPTGSSPLTRGKRSEVLGSHGWPGLIPAHAGKTISRMVWVSGLGAHPRSRGENRGRLWSDSRTFGSSPLTRGKPFAEVSGVGAQGLIPAHAGKTFFDSLAKSCEGAHPRSRGENLIGYSVTQRHLGSSPLTRGKHQRFHIWRDRIRLIPAHAGKTLGPMARPVRAEAHPRSRGENRQPPASSPAMQGSSPLTRGKPIRRRAHHNRGRLIPAHAGKTSGSAGHRTG